MHTCTRQLKNLHRTFLRCAAFHAGVITWSLFTMLTPLAAHWLPLLLLVRALMGLGEGVAFPTMQVGCYGGRDRVAAACGGAVAAAKGQQVSLGLVQSFQWKLRGQHTPRWELLDKLAERCLQSSFAHVPLDSLACMRSCDCPTVSCVPQAIIKAWVPADKKSRSLSLIFSGQRGVSWAAHHLSPCHRQPLSYLLAQARDQPLGTEFSRC